MCHLRMVGAVPGLHLSGGRIGRSVVHPFGRDDIGIRNAGHSLGFGDGVVQSG